MKERIYQFLGLGQKAGYILSGDMQIRDGMRRKKGKLLILATDAARRTAESYQELSAANHIPVCLFGEKEALGHILGKTDRTALLITDTKFSKAVLRKLESEQEGRVWQNTEFTN